MLGLNYLDSRICVGKKPILMILYLNIDLQEPNAELGPKFYCIFLGRPSQKHDNRTPILSVHNQDMFPSHKQLFHHQQNRLTHFFHSAEKLLSLVVLLHLSSNIFSAFCTWISLCKVMQLFHIPLLFLV